METSSGPRAAAHLPDPVDDTAPRSVGTFSRRRFLGGACTAALGLALPACDGPPSAAAPRAAATPPGGHVSLALPGHLLIRGANITVKDSYYPRPWHTLWLDWDWDGWIKRQVDLARTLGVNCIRVIGSVSVVADGALSVERYGAHWDQLLEYLAGLGMLAYPCPGQLDDWGSGTPSQVARIYGQLGEVFSRHANVVAIDVSNEALNEVAGGRAPAEVQAVLSPLDRALRQTVARPLAHSVTMGRPRDWAQPWLQRFLQMSDVLDVHVYYAAAPADAQGLLRNAWADLPVIIGEFGIGTERPQAARIAYFEAIRTLVTSDRRFVGALAWDIASPRFGLFDPGGVARSDVTAVFTTFPRSR